MNQNMRIERTKVIKLILRFVAITYLVSGVGYYIWFHNIEAAALLPILAPFVAYLAVKRFLDKHDRIGYKEISAKGILTGMLIPIVYISIALLLSSVFKSASFNGNLPDGKTVILLFVQWIFAGFCEEAGWRGFLLPMLKKIMKTEIACIVCGLIWGIWHIPMIVQGMMVTQHSLLLAVLLFIVETIFITFIMGSISECNIGRSIWTYVSFHAFHNIVLQITLSMLSEKEKLLMDDGGYLLVALIGIAAAISWKFVKNNKLEKLT